MLEVHGLHIRMRFLLIHLRPNIVAICSIELMRSIFPEILLPVQMLGVLLKSILHKVHLLYLSI